MTKVLILLLILPSIIFAQINWVEDYKSALLQAKAQNKKVMIMFSREGCHVCEMMKEKVYVAPEVINYVNKNFIALELVVDFDDHEGYEVYGTPTYYFLTPEGKQIGDMKVGGATREGFMKTLHRRMKEQGKIR